MKNIPPISNYYKNLDKKATDLFNKLYPDTDEQDEIQENTTSMEEKLEELDHFADANKKVSPSR